MRLINQPGFAPGRGAADQEQHWNVGQRYAAAYVDTQSSAFFENFLIPRLPIKTLSTIVKPWAQLAIASAMP